MQVHKLWKVVDVKNLYCIRIPKGARSAPQALRSHRAARKQEDGPYRLCSGGSCWYWLLSVCKECPRVAQGYPRWQALDGRYLGSASLRDDRTEDFQYDLYGVIVHHGVCSDKGHYYAYVKHKDQWFLLDDTRVEMVSEQKVFDQQAYLLFYSLKPRAELPQGHSSCAHGNGDEDRKGQMESLSGNGGSGGESEFGEGEEEEVKEGEQT